jgi:hypothetical protein
MSIGSFFIAIGITFTILLLIRFLWKPLTLTILTLYVLGHFAFWSFISAVILGVFISHASEGWGLIWLYFFLTYAGIFALYILITADIISMVMEWLRRCIK